MNFHSLRSTWATIVLGFITAVLLASCGGGGAAQTSTGGTLLLLPATGTLYGGVPFTFQILGGRPPYNLSSSEPNVLSLPATTSDNAITVLPANPGVVDQGLPPGSLPVRTVNLTLRDSNGNTTTSVVKVGQNFFTSYGVSFSSSSCPVTGSASSAGLVCSGGDSVMRLSAIINGNLYGGREYRFDVLQGNFSFVNPATGASGNSVGVTTDHSGTATVIVRVPANTPTQVALIRVTDVATGTSTEEAFTITGTGANGALTLIPDTFNFVGPNTATCGTGSGDFFVFDGLPPYTAISADPNVIVSYIDPYHNPGHFSITVNNSQVCVTAGKVIVTDANNNRGTVTVTTTKGTTAPVIPPQPLSVQPNTITLGCGQSGSVSVIGGGTTTSGSGGSGGGTTTTTYSVSSANPNVTATVTGNTVSITRAGPVGPGTGTATSTVNVTDGSTIIGVSVTAPATCP